MEQHSQDPFWKNYYSMIEDVQAAVKRGERIELDDDADARTLGYVSLLNRWTIQQVTFKHDFLKAFYGGRATPPRQKLINSLSITNAGRLKLCSEILGPSTLGVIKWVVLPQQKGQLQWTSRSIVSPD